MTSPLPGTIITNLPVAISLDGSEEVPIVQGGTTKRTTVGSIGTFPQDSASFIMAVATPGLVGSRAIAVQGGVLSGTDGGAGSTFTIGVVTNGIGNAQFRQSAALSVVGNAGVAEANVADISGATDQILRVAGNGLSLAFGSIDLSKSASVGSSLLGVTNGGSGAASFTAYSVLCGGTTSTGALQNVSGVGSSGQVLTSQGAGAVPAWSGIPSSEPVVVVTTSSASIAAKTIAVAVQRTAPSTTALALPTVASQNGIPMHIFDWSTSVTDHAITITPSGSEKIMLASTWPIYSNASSLAGVTLYPSTTLGGWYIAP